MSILPFASEHDAFTPEMTKVLAAAFETVCAELGLSRCGDRLTELVARHVIEAAQQGMSDEGAIQRSVLDRFKSHPQ